MWRLSISIALLMTSACTRQENAADDSQQGNYTAQVIALPETSRDAVFLRAIRDAGLLCQQVRGSERVEARGQPPVWRARCEDGTAHLLSVSAEEVVTVTSRPTK